MIKNIYIASNQSVNEYVICVNWNFNYNFNKENLIGEFEHFFYYDRSIRKLYYAKIASVKEYLGRCKDIRECISNKARLIKFKGVLLCFKFEKAICEKPVNILKDVYAKRNINMIGDRAFSIYNTSKFSDFSYALPIVDEATFMVNDSFQEVLLYDNSIIPENEKERKTFAKIVNEDGELSLTLTNEHMINVDHMYILGEMHGEIYRPYFYEFILSKEAQEKLRREDYEENQLYEVEIISMRKIKDESEEKLLDGVLLFSASPIKRIRSYIKILHTNKNKIVESQYKQIEQFVSNQIITVKSKSKIEKIFMNNIPLSNNPRINYEVKVYDVGQGNWIHILVYDDKDLKAKIIFDIGIGKHTDKALRSSITRSAAAEINDNYMFVLSHWDLDHIQGIVELQRNQFYKTWIVPDLPRRNERESAKRLAAFLMIDPNINAIFIDHSLNGSLIFENKYFKLGKGYGKNGAYNHANNLGLILVIKTERHKMLFPGDCEYIQFPDSFLYNQEYEALIVSHHGAKMMKPDLTSLGLVKSGANKFAVVCVGADKSYPKLCHKKSIEDLGYTIKETRKSKTGVNKKILK